VRRQIEADVFDMHYAEGHERTGRKQLARAIKGPYVADYYLDKHIDPLMTNPEGQARQAVRISTTINVDHR
jgi:Mitochondrial ribosomal subunit S27